MVNIFLEITEISNVMPGDWHGSRHHILWAGIKVHGNAYCARPNRAARIQSDLTTLNTNITHWGMRGTSLSGTLLAISKLGRGRGARSRCIERRRRRRGTAATGSRTASPPRITG